MSVMLGSCPVYWPPFVFEFYMHDLKPRKVPRQNRLRSPGNESPAPIFCSVCKPIVTARFFLIFVWLCSQYFVTYFLTEIMHPISQAYWQGHWPPCMGRSSGPGPLPGPAAPISQPWQRIPQNNVFTLTGGAHHRKLAAPIMEKLMEIFPLYRKYLWKMAVLDFQFAG